MAKEATELCTRKTSSCLTNMDTQPAVPPRDASIEYISDNIFQLTLTTENKDEIFAHGLSSLMRVQKKPT